MAYKHGNFVWFELVTPDVEAAEVFYPETIGWGTSKMDMGDFEYTMVTHDGTPQGGIVAPRMAGIPPHWASYVSVADVDASAKKVKAHGGEVIVPAFDVPNVGRSSLVADPQGATFFLFRGETSDDAGSTVFHWNELWAKDAAAVLSFYRDALGYEAREMPGSDGGYHILVHEGRDCGGVMTSPLPDAPAMWLPYVAVDDPDAVLARAKRHGGAVQSPARDMPGVGRFGILADPAGAALGVIRPAAR